MCTNFACSAASWWCSDTDDLLHKPHASVDSGDNLKKCELASYYVVKES